MAKTETREVMNAMLGWIQAKQDPTARLADVEQMAIKAEEALDDWMREQTDEALSNYHRRDDY